MNVYHIALPHDVSAWMKYLPRVLSVLPPRIVFLETGVPLPEYTIKQLESLFRKVSKGLPPEYLMGYVKKKRLPSGEYFGIVSRCLYLSGKSAILERVPKKCQEYTSRGMEHWNKAIRMFFRKRFEEAAKNVRNSLIEIQESTAVRDSVITKIINEIAEDVILLLGAAHSPKIRGISKWYPKEFEIELEYLQEQKKLIEKYDVELALKMILVEIASLKIPFRAAWKALSQLNSEELMSFCEFVSQNERRACQATLEWLGGTQIM